MKINSVASAVLGFVFGSMLMAMFIGYHYRQARSPVQYGGGTSSVLCEKFGGLSEQREHDISNSRSYDSETVVAICKDGSKVERSWLRIK